MTIGILIGPEVADMLIRYRDTAIAFLRASINGQPTELTENLINQKAEEYGKDLLRNAMKKAQEIGGVTGNYQLHESDIDISAGEIQIPHLYSSDKSD